MTDFERILTQTDACLTRQYQALPETEGCISQEFRADQAPAEIAFQVNENREHWRPPLYTVMESCWRKFPAAGKASEALSVDGAYVDAPGGSGG